MDLLDRVHPVARDLLDRVDATLISAGAPADHPVLPLLRRVGALPGEVATQLADVVADPLTAAGEAMRGQSEGYETGQASVPMPAAWRGPAAESFAARWSTVSGYLAGDPASMAGRLDATASYLDDVAAWLVRARRALAGVLAECLGSAEAATLRSAPAAALGGSGAMTGGVGTVPSAPGTLGTAPGTLGTASGTSGGLGAGTGAAGGGTIGGAVVGPTGSTLGGPAATPRDAARAAADLGAHLLSAVAEILDDGQRVLDAWGGRLDDLPYPVSAPLAANAGGHLEIG